MNTKQSILRSELKTGRRQVRRRRNFNVQTMVKVGAKCVTGDKRYSHNRKYPHIPARDCTVGDIRAGKGQRKYVVYKDNKGTLRWKRLPQPKCITNLKKENAMMTSSLKQAKPAYKSALRKKKKVNLFFQMLKSKVQKEIQLRENKEDVTSIAQRALSKITQLKKDIAANSSALSKSLLLPIVKDAEDCDNYDVLSGEAFANEEEVIHMIGRNGTTFDWCLSKDLIKHYCSEENLSKPPYCEWEGASNDSGRGGECGALKLLQIPSRGGETWMITLELGRKLLDAANSHCSHNVRVVKLVQVAVGSTHQYTGGSSTSHGNNKRWVWGSANPVSSSSTIRSLFPSSSKSDTRYKL